MSSEKKMFFEMVSAINECEKRGTKWKPTAIGIQWAAKEITSLQTKVDELKAENKKLEEQIDRLSAEWAKERIAHVKDLQKSDQG